MRFDQHNSEQWTHNSKKMQIFCVALGVRLLYMTLAHTYRMRGGEDHFAFAWESGRIARALVTGYGYADPFSGHTGPTAWLPPLYPLLLAGIFKVLGVYTTASAWVAVAINCLFSAAVVPAIFEIATRIFAKSKRADSIALWSAWLWALYPAALQYSVHWLWEMSITTCLFTWTLVIALRVRGIGAADEANDNQTFKRWNTFGFLWGLIAMSNPTLLLFLPICGIWMVKATRKNPGDLQRAMTKAALAAVIFISCLVPWTIRNWNAFHQLMPLRGNLGAELYSSLLEGHNGYTWGPTIPLNTADPKFRLYQAMGESAFVNAQAAIAKSYIKTHKVLFMTLALKRFCFFWYSIPHPKSPVLTEIIRVGQFFLTSLTGIAGLILVIRQRVPAARLFAAAFILLPLTYYFVFVGARFRHPLEPLITILSVYLFQWLRFRKEATLAS